MILEGFDISAGTLALLLIGMLPYYVGFTLIPIVYVGKRLNLKDDDFQAMFLGWLSVANALIFAIGKWTRNCLNASRAYQNSTYSELDRRRQEVHPIATEGSQYAFQSDEAEVSMNLESLSIEILEDRPIN